ncbi:MULTISPECIES: hypothetical protein [unclassified Shinella]|uniref:hypothetical protein n=1 Tax=unclassified Shinella TaxID=2643062 RepID=UPI00225D7D47|nr:MULTISPECIES: hypothetical protein [unclassified Shinella]CAI0334068.1 hypothetical protein SHINE37_100171 [Rhizobiaceae bacterium]CAK7261717.1 protein of unknown function [Shinella sp. WSC3-e]MDC7259764.1 ThiF family adenylyltransferase [Shinella sp. YE25]MDC7260367.1 ThiF family adenylyltransferase [Shinella sp. YE25]MDC7267065.1 ThiF family adenylyltransferase [Shinella sp. HY16]
MGYLTYQAAMLIFAGNAGYRGPDVATAIAESIGSREAILAVSQCDVIFSCVDTHEARQIVDLIASAFLIPLFDVGVVIPTRKVGNDGVAIADVCGRIDYVQPGGSTLADRRVFTPESLRAEWLHKANPGAFKEEQEAGYIKGLTEQAPSVISLNMRASSAVVMELIARTFPFRHDANELYARTTFSLAAAEEEYTPESEFDRDPDTELARGAEEPLLGIPALGKPKGRK